MSGGTNKTVTDLIYLHTCSTRRVDLVIAIVLVPHRELLEFAGDVIGRPRVRVPVGVDAIRHGGGQGTLVLLEACEGAIEVLVQCLDRVSLVVAQLADHLLLVASIVTSTARPLPRPNLPSWPPREGRLEEDCDQPSWSRSILCSKLIN